MTKRRTKGEGSVYRRKDGRVVGEYLDANGRQRYITSKNKTKAEMKAAVRKLLEDRDKGIAYDSEGLTVERYLDRWLESQKHNVRLSTYDRIERIVRVNINPTLGNIKLDRLTALQVQSLYQAKLQDGLAPGTVKRIHATLSKALNDAVKWQLLRQSVCKMVTVPRETGEEIRPLTEEQMRALLKTAEEIQPNLYPLYVLAATTAMRIGELIPLRWDCVDLDRGTVEVKHTIWKGVIGPPKSSRGRRRIVLSKLAIRALREQRQKQQSAEWCFPNMVGKPMDYHGFTNKKWKPLLKAAGLPHTTKFHLLRHSALTMMLKRGVNIKVISEIAGHFDVSFSISRYTHVLPDMHSGAADAVDDGLG